MATIQIRNVPEAVHSVYQMWAAAAGMSVQIRNTSWPSSYTTPPCGRLPNLIDDVEARMRVEGREGFAAVSSADLVRGDRTCAEAPAVAVVGYERPG